MQKDFDQWNSEKKGLEISGPESLQFHEREIWWCSIGINLGDEHDGKIFSVILSQLRLVSVKRFRRFVRKISPHQFEVIKNKLGSLLKNH